MWTILKTFIVGNTLKIAGLLLSVLSVAGILLGARQSGKTAERNAALKKQADNVRAAHEIEDNNRKLSDDDVVVELRKWQRD